MKKEREKRVREEKIWITTRSKNYRALKIYRFLWGIKVDFFSATHTQSDLVMEWKIITMKRNEKLRNAIFYYGTLISLRFVNLIDNNMRL